MRKEATLEQWRVLYETATRIGELKPWENFWDMDVIGIQNGAKEDTVFFSILGRGGDCYGVVVYEGYQGLNSFMLLTMHDKMNLASEYAMFNQKNLTCYWGNRDELTEKQRKTIKELGYKYRGKNKWLYFLSFLPGYFPYNLDEDEVLRMSGYFKDLEFALLCYAQKNIPVCFEEGNMLLLSYGEGKKTWTLEEAPLPFTGFQFENLLLTDEELIANLKKVPKGKMVLEADVMIMGASVSDKEYDRPANPALSLLGDAASGVVYNYEMSKPWEDPIINLVEEVIKFIFQYGVPKEIRVSNVIVEAGLEQVCDICGIKLRRVKRLKGLSEFVQEMYCFMQR